MCRSIKTLRGAEPPATEQEITAAALQFVRKVSGFRKPSKANQPAFDGAVNSVADEVRKLLNEIERRHASSSPPAVEEPTRGNVPEH